MLFIAKKQKANIFFQSCQVAIEISSFFFDILYLQF